MCLELRLVEVHTGRCWRIIGKKVVQHWGAPDYSAPYVGHLLTRLANHLGLGYWATASYSELTHPAPGYGFCLEIWDGCNLLVHETFDDIVFQDVPKVDSSLIQSLQAALKLYDGKIRMGFGAVQ